MKKGENNHASSRLLFRSDTDKVLGGVAGGIAQYFEVDSNLIRLIFILLTLLGGSGVLMYIALWVLLPNRTGDTVHAAGAGYTEGRRSGQWFAVIIILLGIFFLLNNFGLLWWFSFQKLWPVVLIILGISIILKNEKRSPPKE